MQFLTSAVLLCFGLTFSVASGQSDNRTCIQAMQAALSVHALDECPEGWYLHGGSCYAFVNIPKTWEDAENYCVNKGGHLTSIHSVAENAFLRKLTYNQRTNSYLQTYVGAHKLATNIWSWSDGTRVTFTDWNPGEPNNLGGVENCVQLNHGNGWNDIYCEYLFPFVCKVTN